MAFCPNFADEEVAQQFNSLESQIGENAAYWYWNRFKGDYSAIQASLTPTGTRIYPTSDSPEIGLKSVSTGMSKDLLEDFAVPKLNLATHPIDEKNNQAIWDVENELDLVSIRTIDGVKYKFYNATPLEDAKKLQLWILQNHIDVKVKLVPAWTKEGNEVGLKLEGYPKNVDKEIARHKAMLENQARIEREEIEKETREDLLPDPMIVSEPVDTVNVEEELANVRNLAEKIGYERHVAKDVLDILDEEVAFSERDKAVLGVLRQHASKLDDLRVEIIKQVDVKKGQEKSYMYYDPENKVIHIVEEQLYKPQHASYDMFVGAIMHEYIHAYTIKAIRERSTPEQKAFAKEMTKLWRTAKLNAINKDMYGYTSVEEFVAEIMTSTEFLEEIQNLDYNLWYRIVKLISDFFGLDLVVGEEVIIDETAFKQVLDFIPTQKEFDTTGQAAAKEAFTAKERMNTIKREIDVTDREGLVKLLRSIENEYSFEKGVGVKHKKSGWSILPVTSVMNQFNLGVDKEELENNEELQEALTRAGSVGTVVHGTIEQILQGGKLKIKNDLDLTSSTGLRSDLIDILRRFEGEEVTVISELYVADPFKALGGKIDLVVIDSKNKVHIYDFKTKEKGFDTWTKRYPNTVDGSLKYSARQSAHAQMTIYKHIFEDITGLTVNSMNAIMLEPTVKDKKITGVKLAKQHNGIDTFNVRSQEGSRIYKAVKNIEARKDRQDEFLSSIPGIEDPQRSYAVETTLESFKYKAFEFSQTENALNKLFKELEKKLEFTKKRGTRSQVEKLESKIEEIRSQEESLDSLKTLISFAMTETAEIRQSYFAKKEKGEDITIGQLFNWKNTVLAYEGFEDYAQYLATQIPMLNIETKLGKEAKVEYSELLRQINVISERVALVKNWYETEGMVKLVDYLAPFYNRLRAEAKNKFIAIWKKYPDKRKGLSQDEYVKRGLAGDEININEKTRLLLLKEMRKASRDIGTLTLWLDNLLDSRDPITTAMVKSFAKTEDLSHKQSLTTRDKILKTLREFEKQFGDRSGVMSYEKLYEFMLEKDVNGKSTGYFIKDKFHSSLWEERDETGKVIGGYMKVVNDTRHLPEDERDDARKEWKDEHTTLRKEEFREARRQFIVDLYKDDNKGWEFTKTDFATLDQHDREVMITLAERARDKSIPKPDTLQELANRGGIPHELASAIEDWVYKNAWEYRDIRPVYKAKYESQQWEGLMKHKEANDVQWQLYSMLMELMDDANSMLPYSSRIAGRLPGVEKRTTEMLKDNMGIAATVRESVKKEFGVRPDDPERDNFTDEGEEKAFLPIHYTGNIKIDLQSFDIPTIVFKFWQSANDFSHKLEILPEMELAKHFIKTRETDPINSRRFKMFKKAKSREEMMANNNNLAKQVEEWFSMAVYGQPKKKQGKLLGLDTAKFVDTLNKYTALNLLGVNVIQGVANSVLGETLQIAERVAGEYMSGSAYRKGTAFYMANFAGVMGDVGRRGAKNVVTRLMETFDVLDEWEGTDFSKRQKYRHAMGSDTLFFTTHAGEHEMQGRFLLSMLADKTAYDSNGNKLGNMLQMYSVNKETGALELDEKVDKERSEWTEDDQFDFQYKVRGILSRLHGEYSDLGRVALQRGALGRMAFMFRKFIVPGFKRRWATKSYIERLDDFVEGNYITTGRFAAKMMTDLIHMKFNMAADWKGMTDHEKANVRRTLTEVTFLMLAILLSNLAIAKLKEGDDEDERMWSFIAYQALRLRAELLFFIKPDETLSILRSPMASMSVAENLIRLSAQLFNPTEIYERGPWKGQPKIYKTLTNMVPGYRQYYRLRDQRDQLSWFSSKIN